MSSPFTPAARPIPVTVVTEGDLPARDEATALIHLDPPPHDHAPGSECVACASAGDIRAMLFDLLVQSRDAGRELEGVVVDARDLSDAAPVLAGLDRAKPALGLRDHTVLKSFVLVGAG